MQENQEENQESFREKESPLPVTQESINERADLTQTIAYFEETSKMNTEAIMAIYQKIDELQEKIGSHQEQKITPQISDFEHSQQIGKNT